MSQGVQISLKLITGLPGHPVLILQVSNAGGFEFLSLGQETKTLHVVQHSQNK